jgi:DNA repair protein RAD51
MAGEDDQVQDTYEDNGGIGPGAPMPISQLEGMNGLTSRDIKLFLEGGYHTVESIAYT